MTMLIGWYNCVFRYFLCWLRGKSTFASITAPWDDTNSVLLFVWEMKESFTYLSQRYMPWLPTIPLYQGFRWDPTWKTLPTHNLTRRVFVERFKLDKKWQGVRSVFTSFPFQTGSKTESVGSYLRRKILESHLFVDVSVVVQRIIFAICHYVNQRLLHPFHTYMVDGEYSSGWDFESDCTLVGSQTCYSFDLTLIGGLFQCCLSWCVLGLIGRLRLVWLIPHWLARSSRSRLSNFCELRGGTTFRIPILLATLCTFSPLVGGLARKSFSIMLSQVTIQKEKSLSNTSFVKDSSLMENDLSSFSIGCHFSACFIQAERCFLPCFF